MELFKIFVSVIAVITSTGALFQIVKIFKRKSAKDLSITNWIMAEVRLLAFFSLAIFEGNSYLTWTIGYSLLMNSIITWQIKHYGGAN